MNELAIPQSVNDKIRARVKEIIFDLMPEEALQKIIDDMLTKQLTGNSVRYTSYETKNSYGSTQREYNYSDPENFYTIIHCAIKSALSEKIKTFIDKILLEKDGEIIKSITKEVSSTMFDSILSEKVNQIIVNAQRGY